MLVDLVALAVPGRGSAGRPGGVGGAGGAGSAGRPGGVGGAGGAGGAGRPGALVVPVVPAVLVIAAGLVVLEASVVPAIEGAPVVIA